MSSVAITKVGDSSGGYRAEREARGFMTTYVRTGQLTVRASDDAMQSHKLSVDEVSKQRDVSGRPLVSTMQSADLRNGDHLSLRRMFDSAWDRCVTL